MFHKGNVCFLNEDLISHSSRVHNKSFLYTRARASNLPHMSVRHMTVCAYRTAEQQVQEFLRTSADSHVR